MSSYTRATRGQFLGKRRSRGVAAVEFAITVPILILVMLITAEFGRAFVHYEKLAFATRSAARYVSQNAISGTSGVVTIPEDVKTAARNLLVYGTTLAGESPLLPGLTADPEHVTVIDAGDKNIEVQVNYSYRPIVGDVVPLFFDSGTAGPLFASKLRISVTMKAIT